VQGKSKNPKPKWFALLLVAHIRSAELGFTVNRLETYRLPFTVSGRLALAHYVPLPWQYCCIFL